MDLTEVRVYPVDDEKVKAVKAFVSITLDHCYVVRDLKVIKGARGLFVAMPRRKMRDGSYKDAAHPLNAEIRRLIENKVLDEYAHFVQRETKTKRPTA